ncbi:hypothetical protein ABZ759_20110 [Streptomyces sp. NPDC047860]|uniref:hypothetical protein n=1 Tax=Streptomyces sp. NPDC047860 TaxID=3155743 RepID=UPI0033D98A58
MPKSAAQAEALADGVVFRSVDWGPGFVPQPVAESRPRTVAALDERCRWQREPLPEGVLASLSRYAELPARDGKGTVRVTAVATVHTSELGADEQLAITLEEVLRCPDQEIRARERLTDLVSDGFPLGRQHWATDNVHETGMYVTAEGAHPYTWSVARLGTVTVGASVKGAKGYTTEELNRWVTRAMPEMVDRVRARTGREN